ncbi:unnamed protein product [Scytosiphon promiscuus]
MASPPSSADGLVVDISSEGANAMERTAIDLTGPETPSTTAAGRRSGASTRSSATPAAASSSNHSSSNNNSNNSNSSGSGGSNSSSGGGRGGRPSSPPVVLFGEQDARFANFTPARRRPRSSRSRGASGRSGSGSFPSGHAPGGGVDTIDLCSDNDDGPADTSGGTVGTATAAAAAEAPAASATAREARAREAGGTAPSDAIGKAGETRATGSKAAEAEGGGVAPAPAPAQAPVAGGARGEKGASHAALSDGEHGHSDVGAHGDVSVDVDTNGSDPAPEFDFAPDEETPVNPENACREEPPPLSTGNLEKATTTPELSSTVDTETVPAVTPPGTASAAAAVLPPACVGDAARLDAAGAAGASGADAADAGAPKISAPSGAGRSGGPGSVRGVGEGGRGATAAGKSSTKPAEDASGGRDRRRVTPADGEPARDAPSAFRTAAEQRGPGESSEGPYQHHSPTDKVARVAPLAAGVNVAPATPGKSVSREGATATPNAALPVSLVPAQERPAGGDKAAISSGAGSENPPSNLAETWSRVANGGKGGQAAVSSGTADKPTPCGVPPTAAPGGPKQGEPGPRAEIRGSNREGKDAGATTSASAPAPTTATAAAAAIATATATPVATPAAREAGTIAIGSAGAGAANGGGGADGRGGLLDAAKQVQAATAGAAAGPPPRPSGARAAVGQAGTVAAQVGAAQAPPTREAPVASATPPAGAQATPAAARAAEARAVAAQPRATPPPQPPPPPPPPPAVAAPSTPSATAPVKLPLQPAPTAPKVADPACPESKIPVSPSPPVVAAQSPKGSVQKAGATPIKHPPLAADRVAAGRSRREAEEEKPCFLYLQVIGPAPTQEKVPPARRVKLARRNSEPVELQTTLSKPGEYTIFVTASMHWTGSGACEDPSEQPIEIKRFRVPESMFALEDAARCGRCGKDLPTKEIRRVNRDPFGSGPLPLRLVPRSGLSFLADLAIHVSYPIRGKNLPCPTCTTVGPPASASASSALLANFRSGAADQSSPSPPAPRPRIPSVVMPREAPEPYSALSDDDVKRALALKAATASADPSMSNGVGPAAASPPQKGSEAEAAPHGAPVAGAAAAAAAAAAAEARSDVPKPGAIQNALGLKSDGGDTAGSAATAPKPPVATKGMPQAAGAAQSPAALPSGSAVGDRSGSSPPAREVAADSAPLSSVRQLEAGVPELGAERSCPAVVAAAAPAAAAATSNEKAEKDRSADGCATDAGETLVSAERTRMNYDAAALLRSVLEKAEEESRGERGQVVVVAAGSESTACAGTRSSVGLVSSAASTSATTSAGGGEVPTTSPCLPPTPAGGGGGGSSGAGRPAAPGQGGEGGGRGGGGGVPTSSQNSSPSLEGGAGAGAGQATYAAAPAGVAGAAVAAAPAPAPATRPVGGRTTLDGFRHALGLLANAVKVGAGNHVGESRRVLEPVFDRLGEAVAVARAAGSIEPESLDRFQRDFKAIRREMMGAACEDPLQAGTVETLRAGSSGKTAAAGVDGGRETMQRASTPASKATSGIGEGGPGVDQKRHPSATSQPSHSPAAPSTGQSASVSQQVRVKPVLQVRRSAAAAAAAAARPPPPRRGVTVASSTARRQRNTSSTARACERCVKRSKRPWQSKNPGGGSA